MSCVRKIAGSINYDCANKSKAGIEAKALVFNRSDIDLTALTKGVDGVTVTNISLKSGAVAYEIDNLKQVNSVGSDFVKNDNGINTYSNKFLGRVYQLDAMGVARVAELGEADGLVVIVETKAKGTDNASAFKIFGLDQGMTKSEGAYTSNAEGGSYVFTIASEEGYEEDVPFYIWTETDYASTKAKFDNLLAPVV